MHSEAWIKSYARAMRLTFDEAKELLAKSEDAKRAQGFSETFQKTCARCDHIRADTKRLTGVKIPEDESKWKAVVVRRYCDIGKFTVKKFNACDKWEAKAPNAR